MNTPDAICTARKDRNGDCHWEHVNGGAITIFLCGDVMTGRGIDQILPHPSKPILYEPYVDSALDYVAMAEKTNGSIPRPANFSYMWGDALAELDRGAPAARIVNLETSITGNDVPAPKGINYRMNPANTPCLAAAGIDCCVLANNHVLDWGRSGLEETLHSLREAGIGAAGAGFNLAEAVQPRVVETTPAGAESGSTGRVLVFAFATADSGVPPEWGATATQCGISYLPDFSEAAADRLAAQVSSVRRPGDVAVVSAHWGGNWGYGTSRSQRSFAHRLIDSGAVDLIHGHSSHHRKAIEVYRNKLILYGCGDFLNDYEGIGGFEEFRGQLVLMYFATFDPSARSLVGLEMTALEIHRFRLRNAGKDDVQWLQEVLNREGEPFGSRTIAGEANRLKLAWARS
jgi:poly-gamma-glutamate synthesis protein (capsule biosynthesis protein)